MRLDAVLAELAAMEPRPDLLLATGDLVDRGDRRQLPPSARPLRAAAVPGVLAGRQSRHPRQLRRSVSRDAGTTDGFFQYVVETRTLRLVVLDTLEEGRHGGAFCERRAAWLTARLDEEIGRPTLIVQHHPPIEVGIPWMNTNPAEPWVARLAACLEGRANVVGLICGHIHRAITTQWHGLDRRHLPLDRAASRARPQADRSRTRRRPPADRRRSARLRAALVERARTDHSLPDRRDRTRCWRGSTRVSSR